MTVTLPKSWTEKYNVKSGDELNIEEKGRNLLLSSENQIEMQKVTIDATNFSERVARLTLSAAHKTGFDEINVIYNNTDILNVIHELIKDLYLGFSIVEQTDKRCLIKAITKDKADEFDVILRRGWLIALSMSESCYDLIKKKQFSSLKTLVPLEHYNNQFTNFCERIINKKAFYDEKKAPFYYVISWNLEKVCDNYKYICDRLIDNNKEVNPGILDYFLKVNSLFRGYYEVFYSFDINKIVKLNKEGKELLNNGYDLHKDAKAKHDFTVLNNLMTVVLQCLDFSASYIAINQFKEN